MRLKGFLTLILMLVIAISLCGCGEGNRYPEPKDGYAHDFADIISSDVEDYINSQGKLLREKTTAEVVVVAVSSLDGEAPEDYAMGIGREWDIGDSDKKNGVVILLAKEDRAIEISTSRGAEGALPATKVGRILDSYTGYLSKGDYSTALKGIFNKTINELYSEYGVTPPDQDAVLPNIEREEEVGVGKVLISWIVLIVLVVLYILIFGRRGGMFIFGAPRFYGGFGGFGRGGGSGSSFGGFGGGGSGFGGGGSGRRF